MLLIQLTKALTQVEVTNTHVLNILNQKALGMGSKAEVDQKEM